jgi:hypothetical protein
VEVIVDYTQHDYIDAMRCYSAYRPLGPKSMVRGTLTHVVDLAIIGAALGAWYVFSSMSAGLFAVSFVVTLGLWRYIRRFWWIPTGSFDGNSRWREVRHWNISEKGIEIHSESVDTTIKWTFLNGVLECQPVFLFFQGDPHDPDWFFVPKRVFDSIEEINTFRAELNRHTALTQAQLNVLNFILG